MDLGERFPGIVPGRHEADLTKIGQIGQTNLLTRDNKCPLNVLLDQIVFFVC